MRPGLRHFPAGRTGPLQHPQPMFLDLQELFIRAENVSRLRPRFQDQPLLRMMLDFVPVMLLCAHYGHNKSETKVLLSCSEVRALKNKKARYIL